MYIHHSFSNESKPIAIYRGNDTNARSYDKISLFDLRPVELLELVANVSGYYRWFIFGK